MTGAAPDEVAAAIRRLAASIRSGIPPRAALESWHAGAPPELRPALLSISRRLELGAPLADAFVDAACVAPVLRCFELHRATGGSLPRMLAGVADSVERDGEVRRQSRAATAGARLSGRLVAGLPLAFVPLTSGAGAFRTGPLGVALLLAGVALAALGLWWIGKLVPSVDGDDCAAALAEDVAIAIDGGIGLSLALEAAASHRDDLGRVRRRVILGAGWVDALSREGGPLASVAQVLARSIEWGTPVARPLREWARARREDVRTEHARALQRAPVLMVVPLTVCVLPSFALLAFGPWLLGAMQTS